MGMSTARLARIGGLAARDRGERSGGWHSDLGRKARKSRPPLGDRDPRALEVSDPMPPDALFDIASMTKPLTAIAALMLYEEGRITLD